VVKVKIGMDDCSCRYGRCFDDPNAVVSRYVARNGGAFHGQ
jgi:hypothetical protein